MALLALSFTDKGLAWHSVWHYWHYGWHYGRKCFFSIRVKSLMGKKNPCLLQQGSDQSEVYRAFMKKL
jgi:hypothetical protein